MAISTTSFSLTPQATGDTFVYTEDTSGMLTLDVMSNDLGGAAKTLYSLDDGLDNDGTTGSDLLIKDTARAEATSNDTSLNGAKIWITSDGKVGYDSSTLSSSFRTALQALGDGQTMTDTFTYAIRLANGTLSWTTATVVYTGVNDAPVLTDPSNISFVDTSTADAFTAATGTLHATDVDSSTITFGLTGGAADNSLAGYDVSKASAYGTMYLNTTTGDYTFVPDDAAINGLQAGDTPAVNFEFTASDGSLSSAQTLTVNITGANDNPTLTDPTDFSFTDTSAADTFSAASGSLSAADVDSASSGFTYDLTGAVSDNSHAGFDLAASSAYGTMYLNSATGAYEFVADDAAVNALQAGDTPTVSFTFTVNDGDGGSASQTLDVNITGANDAPTLTDPTDISITDTAAADTFSAASGNLSASDVDSTGLTYDVNGSVADNSHLGFDLAASSTYGTMYLNSATGAYEFVADDAAVNALQDGDTPTVSFTFTVNDGDGGSASQTLDVNITGANDAPTLTDPTDISITDTAAADTLSASGGSLSASDVDSTGLSYDLTGAVSDNSHAGFDLAASSAYGTMYLNSSTGAYEFVADDAAVNALQDGDTPTVSFTFTVNDGDGGSASQTLDVNITGANDAPTLTDPTDIGITDTSAADTFSASSGSLSANDGDSTGLTYDVNGSVADNSHLGFDLAASSTYGTMYLNSATGAYEFVADDAAVNALQDGDTPTVSFTFTVNDGDGGSASQTLDVNITGANDAPVIDEGASDLAPSGLEDNAILGTVVAGDVDSATLTWSAPAQGDPNGPVHGSVSFDASGNYTYTPDADYNGTDSFTVTVSDGDGGSDTVVVNLTVTPVNDAPVLSDPTDISYTDTSAADNFVGVTSSLSATDIDSATLSYSLTGAVSDGSLSGYDVSKTTSYGTMYLNSATGAYHFEPNDAAINGLAAGSNPTVDFEFTASDGSASSNAETLTVHLTGADEASGAPVAPPVYTGTGDPNDFDSLGASTGDNLSSAGTNSNDTLYGGAGNDTINGGGGDDTIYGGSGADGLNGNSDSDALYGGSGSDTIIGSNGDDHLIGGYGADTLTGSNGIDTFVYLSTLDTGDTITDFTHGTDKIDLSALDANTATLANDAFTFVAADTNAVQANSVTFHYDSVAGVTHIWADVNGDTTADLQIDLTGNIALSSGDFIL